MENNTITKGANIPIDLLTKVNEKIINVKLKDTKQNVTFSEVVVEALEKLVKEYEKVK